MASNSRCFCGTQFGPEDYDDSGQRYDACYTCRKHAAARAQALSPFAREKRAIKVSRLVAQIDTQARYANLDPLNDAAEIADMVQRFSPKQWAQIALLAISHPPGSRFTIDEVVRVYRARAASSRRLRAV